LTATERTLCCLLENYQTADGLVVPEVLRKYIPGSPEFLPFVKDLPKDSTSQKAKGKTDAAKKQPQAEAQKKLKDLKLEDGK
jgi:seryl-tRNA synthetase